MRNECKGINCAPLFLSRFVKCSSSLPVFLFFFLVLAVIFFRNTIGVIFGDLFANLSLVLLFLLFPFFLLVPLNRQFGLLFSVYFIYLVIQLFFGLSRGSTYAVVGFFNLAGPLFFLISAYLAILDKTKIFNFGVKLFIVFAFINSLGAIIQTQVSIDIFGLIHNDIYANYELMSGGGVQKRAISFITSPQSLSLTLAFATALIFYTWPVEWSIVFRVLCFVLIVFVGALTVSKVYFVFLFVVFFVMSIKKISSIFIFLLGFLVVGVLASATNYFDRIFLIFDYIVNIRSYPAYEHWARGFQHVDSAKSLLFGNGIGFYSRGGQILQEGDSIIGVESFLIQVFSEIGLVGFSLFSLISGYSYYLLRRKNKSLGAMLLAFVAVGFFTPAPYGFVVGMQMCFLLVAGFFSNRIDFGVGEVSR